MSWFEAYLIWTLGDVKTMFAVIWIVILSVGGITALVVTLTKGIEGEMDDVWKWCKKSKKYLVALCIVWCVSFFLSNAIPSTTTLFKIIATKKGVDAFQSQATQGYIDTSGKIVDNGLKLLNQTIEDALKKDTK